MQRDLNWNKNGPRRFSTDSVSFLRTFTFVRLQRIRLFIFYILSIFVLLFLCIFVLGAQSSFTFISFLFRFDAIFNRLDVRTANVPNHKTFRAHFPYSLLLLIRIVRLKIETNAKSLVLASSSTDILCFGW